MKSLFFLFGLAFLLSCSQGEKISGKTTTTTNGISFRRSDGSTIKLSSIRAARKSFSNTNKVVDILDLNIASDTIAEIDSGTWELIEIKTMDSDSGTLLHSLQISKDSSFLAPLSPLVHIQGDSSFGAKNLFLDQSFYSANINQNGTWEFSGIPLGNWILLSEPFDSETNLQTKAFISFDSTFTENVIPVIPQSLNDSLFLSNFENKDSTKLLDGNLKQSTWRYFNMNSILISPPTTDSLYQALSFDSLTKNHFLKLQYHNDDSTTYSILSLQFDSDFNLSLMDSVCMDLQFDGEVKVEWVSEKGELSKSPGFFFIDQSPTPTWKTLCLQASDFTPAPSNPENLRNWTDFAPHIRAFQILGYIQSSWFAIDNLRIFGPVFIENP